MNQQYVCKIQAENLYPKKSKERKTLIRFYLVADESHPSIMWPCKADDRGIAVINELNRPPTFILDPDENDARSVTRSQFLIRFVPSNKSDL